MQRRSRSRCSPTLLYFGEESFRRPVSNSFILTLMSQTPPTPDSTSDVSSSSRLSMETASEFDELPEIPFVSSAALAYPDRWISPDHHPPRADNESERSFWSSMIRSSPSKSSDRTLPVFGNTGDRVVVPSRQRSGSVTSSISSRSKPAPAKSILSSSASIKTKTRRSPPSVKFLDMPTIHYEDDEYEYEPCRGSAAPKEKRRLAIFRWFWGPKSAPAVPTRPAISGPFPLWDAPPRRVREQTASLRSAKSNSSLRSVRSCSSRLHTFWDRVTNS